jgi:hypothetical protein
MAWKSPFSAKLPDTILAHIVPPSAAGDCCVVGRGGTWYQKWEHLNYSVCVRVAQALRLRCIQGIRSGPYTGEEEELELHLHKVAETHNGL